MKTQIIPQCEQDFRNEVQAYAVLPLMVGEEVLGTLYLDLRQKYTFSPESQDPLLVFGRQAAIAVENARLYADQQEKARTLAALNEAGKDLIAQSDPQSVMECAAQHAQVILRADAVVIYRCDQTKQDVLLPPTYVGVNNPQSCWKQGSSTIARWLWS